MRNLSIYSHTLSENYSVCRAEMVKENKKGKETSWLSHYAEHPKLENLKYKILRNLKHFVVTL